MGKEAGQIILILILVMTVALVIGISVVQRSLSDISTSSKVEQSGRAFSAAEAGIEKAIQSDSPITTSVDLGNNSVLQSVEKADVPAANQALEYPPIGKEEMAQVWLANPSTLTQYYNEPYLEIAWGATNISNPDDKPAIEINVVYLAGSSYQSKKFYFDSNSNRASSNGFNSVSCSDNPATLNTSMGNDRVFYCRNSLIMTDLYNASAILMLLRARILYSSTSQPFAVLPWGGSCGTNVCSLPPQARIFTSIGTAGDTQRKIQVFRLNNVVPFYFDYAIFSTGDITK